MSGGEAHVENSVWMRAVLIGGVFLTIGILAFGAMGVGVANVKHADWDEKKLNYERVTTKQRQTIPKRTRLTTKPTRPTIRPKKPMQTNRGCRRQQYDQRTTSSGQGREEANELADAKEPLRADKEEKKQIKLQLSDEKYDAKMDKVDAHLSYLTWRTAGITILLMCITYAAFRGIGWVPQFDLPRRSES